MNKKDRFDIPRDKIVKFCKRNHIHKLSTFGSILRGDFHSDSDVDILVEFEPDHIPGYIRLSGMEIEFSEILGGRRVDINTPQCLSRYFRDEVLAKARVQYVQG